MPTPSPLERFEYYLRASYPIIWVCTLEPHRAETVLGDIALKVHEGCKPARWDIAEGFRTNNAGQPCPPSKAVGMAAALPNTTTFFWNLHRFLGAVDLVQAVQNAIPALKANGACLVILAPDQDKLPPELARFVVTFDFPLPDCDQLAHALEDVHAASGLTAAFDRGPMLAAAAGLTASEAEDAFALSVVEKRAFDPGVVAREKAGSLLRQAKLSLEHYPDTFSDLGGLDTLKRYTLATAKSPLSLGIMLLGVPGAGKTSFARALGNELGIPTLSMDFGRMMSSLVGSSEATIREALKAVDAMGRCVLFIDELR